MVTEDFQKHSRICLLHLAHLDLHLLLHLCTNRKSSNNNKQNQGGILKMKQI